MEAAGVELLQRFGQASEGRQASLMTRREQEEAPEERLPDLPIQAIRVEQGGDGCRGRSGRSYAVRCGEARAEEVPSGQQTTPPLV